MADGTSKLPIENEDMKAGMLAAFARIESVPTKPNLIDSMPDEEWHSGEAENWVIEVGSSKGGDEIDDLDKDVVHAA